MGSGGQKRLDPIQKGGEKGNDDDDDDDEGLACFSLPWRPTADRPVARDRQ